jgi:hypothetical protein
LAECLRGTPGTEPALPIDERVDDRDRAQASTLLSVPDRDRVPKVLPIRYLM